MSDQKSTPFSHIVETAALAFVTQSGGTAPTEILLGKKELAALHEEYAGVDPKTDLGTVHTSVGSLAIHKSPDESHFAIK